MRHTTRTITSETYRGISLEVSHPHGEAYDPTWHPTAYGWCGYIYLNLDQVADEKLRRSLWPRPTKMGIGERKFTSHPGWLDNLPFHGGVTYFERRYGSDGGRIVKVGCDYRHYMDDDRDYDEDIVLYDLREVVDALHEFTTYLMWCAGDGHLAPESEGTIPEGWDRWYSFSYMQTDEHFLKHHTADGKKIATDGVPS